jgi:hypothetical protein
MHIRNRRSWLILLAMMSLLFTACDFPGDQSPQEEPDKVIAETPTQDGQSGSPSRPKATKDGPGEAPTSTVTLKPIKEQPMLTANVNANCRTGPNIVFDEYGYLLGGESASAVGRLSDNSWFVTQLPDHPQPCWISAAIVSINFDPSVLEILRSPPTPTPILGSIGGVLWHEICEFTGGQAGEPVVLGQGCVSWGDPDIGEFGPNQVIDDFETGWAGVTLHIGNGPCPSTGLATAVTNANGVYRFSSLPAGTYCVSYSALMDGNDAILIPGGPTFPQRGADGFYQTVTITEGENNSNANFGFAWQFYD